MLSLCVLMGCSKNEIPDPFLNEGISRDEKAYANEKSVTLDETPIALDGFIFITHKNNPVKTVTREQIRGIYMGEITNWKEVGGKDLAITPYIREPNSGSQEKMETIVMKGLEMPKWQFTSLLGMGDPFERL